MSGAKNWHEIRRTMLDLDEDQIRTRANTTAARLADTTVLLVRMGDQPVREYAYGDTDSLTQAGKLGGFDAIPLPGGDWPDLPGGGRGLHARHAIVPWRARLNSMSNMERLRERTRETRKSIESLMPPDSIVSVSLRRRGALEQARIRDWVADEGNTVEDENDLVRANTLCARVTAATLSKEDSRGLAAGVGQSLTLLSDVSEHPSAPRFGLFAASLALLLTVVADTLLAPLPWASLLMPAAILAGVFLVHVGARVVKVSPPDWWYAVPLTMGLLMLPGILTTPPAWTPMPFLMLAVACLVRWVRRDEWDDILRRPWPRFAFKARRAASTADMETRMGGLDTRRRVTDYPLHRSTLAVPPLTVVSLMTPVTDAQAVTQDAHPVPETLARGGVLLGADQTGRKAFVIPDQLYKGVAITGEQGSGKSVLTYGFMQWALAHRGDTPDSVWGRGSSIVDFAMKDDHAVAAMARYHEARGERPARSVTYLADERYATLDMCGLLDGKDAAATATGIAAAMQYSFDDGDIRNDSLDVITSAMTIAVTAVRYEQERERSGDARMLPLADRIHALAGDSQCFGADRAQAQKSPIGWALMALCGSDGQTGSARALGKVMRALAVERPCDDTVEAARAAEQLYGRPDSNGRNTVSDSTLLQRTNASRNKVRQFMACEHVFTPARGRLTWERILGTPGEYHIVLAPHDGRSLPERMDRILGAWLMYRMWNTMTAVCQGWQSQGRHVMLVCDELSMLAAADTRILCQLHEQGRSFGLILVFATQYVKQFTPELMDSFTGYGTYVSFNTSDPGIAQLTADRLTDSDGADGWTRGAVVNLPAHWAAVRTRTAEQTQPSFLVHVRDFESDPLQPGE